MFRKVPRYRFSHDAPIKKNLVGEFEFVSKRPRPRFDAVSVLAAGIIGVSGCVVVAQLLTQTELSGRVGDVMETVDHARKTVGDVWRIPFRRIWAALD